MMTADLLCISDAFHARFPVTEVRGTGHDLSALPELRGREVVEATDLVSAASGQLGMRRRVADYPTEFGTVNLFVSFAALNIALSTLVFVFNMARSWSRGPMSIVSSCPSAAGDSWPA